MTSRWRGAYAVLALTWVLTSALSSSAFAQRGGPPPAPPTPRAGAPFDPSGTWVSVVTEDWRYRMVTPTKGDYQGVPMTVEAARLADAWDPAADERAGVQCKSYGAPALMRVPGRLRVSWQSDDTLKLEMDTGTQTRLLHFGPFPKSVQRTWQGDSVASWQVPVGRGGTAGPPPGPDGGPGGRRGPPANARPGSMKIVTTNLRAGYLRKNGVPYSENTVLTEYLDRAQLRDGTVLLVVTSVVEDPKYLTQPFITSTQFKREPDGSKWEATPCSATW